MRQVVVICCLLMLCGMSLFGNETGVVKHPWKGPWGKDVKLVKEKPICQSAIPASKAHKGWLEHLASSAIWFHKNVISPADGPRSHFRPNSSQYTLDAIERYGFWQGYLLGCDRLMRENPESWVYPTLLVENHWLTKWDPVK